MFCPKCSKENADGSTYCTSCGAPLAGEPAQGTIPVRSEYRIGEWMSRAWDLSTKQIWPMVLLGVLITVPGTVIGMVIGFPLRSGVGVALEDNSLAANLIGSFLGAMVSWPVSAAVITPLVVGVVAVLLNYTRTNAMDLSLLGTGYRKWKECFVLGIWPGLLVVLPSAVPCLVILLPLVLAAYMWYAFAQIALAEPGATQSRASDRGLALVKSNFWYAVLLMLVGVGVGILGALACGVGIFFAMPLFWLAVATGYDQLTRGAGPGNASSVGSQTPG